MHRSDFRQQYEQHLDAEHSIGSLQEYLKEIVYGGNDGIITTFAIVSGFSGAALYNEAGTLGSAAVLIFGLANLFADSVSMGLGNFLSLRAEADLYHKNRIKEKHEISHNPKFEYQETIEILQSRGITLSDAKKFATLYQRNPEFWTDFMMDYELELPDVRRTKPACNAFFTFISFLLFGSVPLLPYFIFTPSLVVFYWSVGSVLLALTALGFLRWYVAKQSLVRCLGETILLGGICAIIAYGVGFFFR